jgi:phosphoglycerol transferase MdoB-like AlkP superfamily enzyme
MWGGLRFDLTAIIYLNGLFILLSVIPLKSKSNPLYQKILFYIFLLTNGIGYAFNILDIFYFDFVLKRSTIELFMFASEGNIGLLFIQFLKDYWMGFLFWFSLLYISYKYYKMIPYKVSQQVKNVVYYPTALFIMLLVIYFSIIGVRGGFTRTTRPISLNNAGAYIHKPLEMAIVLNTPFTIFRTLDVQAFSPKKYYSNTELESIYSPVKHFETDSAFTNKNVVLIVVESLAKEYFGSLNTNIVGYEGYTPFLDSLIIKSHTFTNAFANGRKSIDALPSVVASVPSLVQPYILSPYATNEINGLGSLLSKKGYKTAFFHGAPNGSMGFDAFMNTAGYKEYYGYDEYNNPDDFDGNWGIWDEKFLQFTATKLNEFKSPFLATIFTLSSHHPFKIPEEFTGKFKKGTLPIHQPIQYLDYSLQQFFKTASEMPWFNNTIFVITADHCNQSILPEYQSAVGRFAIPIIIYQPDKPETAQMDDTVSQQADILPKILRELNYSGDFVSFGTDIQTEDRPFAVNYYGQTWNYYEGDYLLQFRDEKKVGLFLYKKDRVLNNNLLAQKNDIANYMERKLKAYIQQYYNRLIENRMVINKNQKDE